MRSTLSPDNRRWVLDLAQRHLDAEPWLPTAEAVDIALTEGSFQVTDRTWAGIVQTLANRRFAD